MKYDCFYFEYNDLLILVVKFDSNSLDIEQSMRHSALSN